MATLLAVEVVNIEAAVELLHPSTLSTLLQQYQFYLRQAARLYRGTVTQVSGNMAVVAFDVRQCQDEHAFNAICCGQLFLQLMERLTTLQQDRTTQELQFNVAVHSGDLYFSLPWKSTKSEKDTLKAETMIGPSLAIAQELLAHAESKSVLASELSYDLANGSLRFPAKRGENVEADNRAMMTFSIPPSAGSHSDFLEKQCLHLLPTQAPNTDSIPTLTPIV